MNSINLENTYTSLPQDFFRYTEAETMPDIKLIKINEQLSDLLDIDISFLTSQAGLRFLSGKNSENLPNSISLAYAGHQFGHLVPQLGDGRAVLLGDKICKDGVRRDIQLKGSGKTYFSRGGDGRAGIGPVIREYLISESMHHLGVPTTRSLAVLSTGEKVVRAEVTPGAMLARVATSHVRVGTFEFFALRNQRENIRKLADFMIERSHPDLCEKKKKYELFFERIVIGQARLVAQWNSVGFIHGVMNTDNTSISYETIDYGPCAFMDSYEANKVFSSIDQFGRYAFSNQARVAPWNLSRLAETILFLISENTSEAIKVVEEILFDFDKHFNNSLDILSSRKLGIKNNSKKTSSLYSEFLNLMEAGKADFTGTFKSLKETIIKEDTTIFFDNFKNSDEDNQSAISQWLGTWRKLLQENSKSKTEAIELLSSSNPKFVMRNHLVENAIGKATKGDFSDFDILCDLLTMPFEIKENYEEFYKPPTASQVVHQTFCGT
jgi:uncharacterized protein YdiU (UPF0061 family)